MIGLVATLLGSKTGRTAAVVLLALASAGLLLWRVFAAGQRDEQLKQTQASLDAVREKVKSDESIRRMPAAARRKRLLDEWSR